jgi:hypothetical protein
MKVYSENDWRIVIATAIDRLKAKRWRFSDCVAEDAFFAVQQAKTQSDAVEAIELSLSASRIRA